eukprot:4011884-Pleurochrysis_carterae.AAC.3
MRAFARPTWHSRPVGPGGGGSKEMHKREWQQLTEQASGCAPVAHNLDYCAERSAKHVTHSPWGRGASGA